MHPEKQSTQPQPLSWIDDFLPREFVQSYKSFYGESEPSSDFVKRITPAYGIEGI